MRSASSPPSSPAMPTTRRGSDIAWCPSCGEPMAMSIRESYDSVARTCAAHLASELSGKPLDRHLLNRFAEEVRGRGLVADLGCGPGHIANYLHDQGASVLGMTYRPRWSAGPRASIRPSTSVSATCVPLTSPRVRSS